MPGMPRIQLLPDHLISQIAAGEVVERPASVVKELVENSLDAGAGEITIELESGGKRRIVVEDDGSGLGKDDALLAFDRHATSKIASFEDLERVGTLGFRGEALASIAAVARVELISAETPGEGHRVRIEGGRVRSAQPHAHPRGTRISVASLFFNVPARRKFLKTPRTELRRAVEVVQGYALARPDVRFRLVHEGREMLDAVPAAPTRAGEGGHEIAVEAARERIAQIFDRDFAEKLSPIPPLPEAAAGRGERVWGLVGNRQTTRGRRYFVFVNRRMMRDRAVMATFYRAVREVWQKEDFPALFLFLDVPPEDVDVNVHPQKAEVRFRDPRFVDRVGERLRLGLERALGEEAAPLRQPGMRPGAPLAGQGLGGRPPGGPDGGGRDWRTGGPRDWSGVARRGADWPAPGDRPAGEWEVRESAPGTPAGQGVFAGGGRLATATYRPLERSPVPLSGRSGEVRPFRLLGQYKGTLILLEGPDGLYLIDQHVAHERLLFERLRDAMRQETTASQNLLTPVMLDLSAPERMRLEELAPSLEEHGFGVAPLSGNDLALTAVPAVLSFAEGEELVRALATSEDDDSDGEGEADAVARQVLDALAASMACKGAVKMHHPLSPEEMETLVAELFEAENPYACPHGRPIVLQMTDSDLEHRFGRR